MRNLKRKVVGTGLVIGLALTTMLVGNAHADTFGSGANQFTMDFVTVGNPGNPDDTNTTGSYSSPHGGVDYIFRMGTYEVSRDMIIKANAEGGLGITLDDFFSTGGGSNGDGRPATGVSWNEAARFVNWLNTSNGSSAAYKFARQPGDGSYSSNANIELWMAGDAGFDASNPFRNSNAAYFLPSEDEWYKAAYYSGSGTTYFDYPTGSNTVPDGIDSIGDPSFEAVFSDDFSQGGPNDIDNVGSASSPYGTFGQGGNAFEWTESASSEFRIYRGGIWYSTEYFLRSSVTFGSGPTFENFDLGFRVASVPEPSAAVMLLMSGGGFLLKRRRAPFL